MRLFKEILGSEDGATAVEYAVMLALIIVTVIGAIGSVGANTAAMWGDINTDLATNGFGS